MITDDDDDNDNPVQFNSMTIVKQIVNIAVKNNNCILVITLFIMVASYFDHS